MRRGDRVGIMSSTRYEWTLVDYALWYAGAVPVPIYETSSAEQVEWILSDSGAVGVFLEGPKHAAVFEEVRGTGLMAANDRIAARIEAELSSSTITLSATVSRALRIGRVNAKMTAS